MFRAGADHHSREGGMTMRPKRHADMNDAIVRGSWTGVPWDEDEEPVQDADDL